MGVNIFILDRRTVTLVVGSSRERIGTLRRFFKITELDEARASELTGVAQTCRSPVAVMLADISELPLVAFPDKLIHAHLVLGWDEGRGSVTDFGWDYLPKLGYAVQNPASGDYILHEERSGRLVPIDDKRARELGIVDTKGRLTRRGQPRIVNCQSVIPYGSDYAEADCVFDNGMHEKIFVRTEDGHLPPKHWFIGKQPRDVEQYFEQQSK